MINRVSWMYTESCITLEERKLEDHKRNTQARALALE